MKADPDAIGSDGNTPLHNAGLKGAIGIAKLLLQNGARVGVFSSAGTLPIHDAAVAGHAQILSLLLAHGASSESRTRSSGETALHFAAAWNRVEAVRVLLAAGARVDVRDAKQRTPLNVASENGNSEIVGLLAAAAK